MMSRPITDAPAAIARDALRGRLVTVALQSPEFRHLLEEAATEIRSLATPSATEATIEGGFERVMYALLRDIGLRFHPEKEVGVETRRHLTRGRTDSRLGALVIEYKRPALLTTPASTDRAISQLEDYLIALSANSHVPRVGILTNGLVAYEISAVNGEITQRSGAHEVNAGFLSRLTRSFISLALTALTSENLIRDFCGSESDGVLFSVARVLDAILATQPSPKTNMLRMEWEELFRLAHDDQSQQRRIEERRLALATIFQIAITDPATEYRTLFALHTAYALLLKFIAYQVVYDAYFGQHNSQDFRSLAATDSSALRMFCTHLEDGDVFRSIGILNLLEGDFFSWYCDQGQWNTVLSDAIKTVLSNLARYEDAKSVFDRERVTDLFRDLYQAAVPRVVRSSFGEFYTPLWLAEHVLKSTSLSGDWRVLDPCCGSGTFIIAAIAHLRDTHDDDESLLLPQILGRVAAIDLNPLAVLTTRIHYFIHINDLISDATQEIIIPVYLGDASSIPERIDIDGIDCLRFTLSTLKAPISATLPVSLVENTPMFMRLMHDYERYIRDRDAEAACRMIIDHVTVGERTDGLVSAIQELTNDLIALEVNGWNGIWARILSNFLTTACLGRFSAVIGNPPWIDWKNLPAGYRERIKAMCIDRGLFSGAGRTGGINLNVCALIAHVSMSNWLSHDGVLAFLMPRELANQASYEGWRRLGGGPRTFLAFHDWSDAGHPFDPVKEDFMTFLIGDHRRSEDWVPVDRYVIGRRDRTPASKWSGWSDAAQHLRRIESVAGQVVPNSTAFTFASSPEELARFALIAGDSEYIGREGIEFYPQELLVFRYDGPGPREGTVWLRNIQVTKAKYRVPERRILLESRYLYPLVKGPEIQRFNHNYSGLIVAFPYDATDPLRPVPADRLRRESPMLLDYFHHARELIEKQTKFSDKIRGADPGEYYGLARTGPYSFANNYVAFRDNTKWCATVITPTEMPWGEPRRFVFQNHAVSMCERRRGGFIGYDEAHYACAILNTPIVERFINSSSDSRSFKIRPPVYIPTFNPSDETHQALVAASMQAHRNAENIDALRLRMEEAYLEMCRHRVDSTRL